MNDAAMVSRAQRGDVGAFEVLARRHGSAITNYLSRFMPDEDDVEDLFQEVFLKAYLNLSRFEASRGSFRAWLFRIAANASLDELKRRRRSEAKREAAAELWTEMAEEIPVPDNERQAGADLRSALQSLPDTERQVILLSFYHDLKYREIAGILDVPLGTIKSRMRSAMSRLRQKVALSEVGDTR